MLIHNHDRSQCLVAQSVQELTQGRLAQTDIHFAHLLVSAKVLSNVFAGFLVCLLILAVVGDETCQALVALESAYFIVEAVDAADDGASDVLCLFPVVDSAVLVLLLDIL